MGGRAAWVMPILVAFAATSCSEPAAPPPITPRVGSDYGPVSAKQLEDRHSVSAAGRPGARFVWEFHGDQFTVTGDGGPIPDDALVALLGGRQAADVIEGRWVLSDRVLVLSGITAGGRGGFKDVTLRPFRTPVLRMYLDGTQYVFTPFPPGAGAPRRVAERDCHAETWCHEPFPIRPEVAADPNRGP